MIVNVVDSSASVIKLAGFLCPELVNEAINSSVARLSLLGPRMLFEASPKHSDNYHQ